MYSTQNQCIKDALFETSGQEKRPFSSVGVYWLSIAVSLLLSNILAKTTNIYYFAGSVGEGSNVACWQLLSQGHSQDIIKVLAGPATMSSLGWGKVCSQGHLWVYWKTQILMGWWQRASVPRWLLVRDHPPFFVIWAFL